MLEDANASNSDLDLQLPSFVVSAPGKVIISGEHAVVHGMPAMAASMSQRTFMLVTPDLGAESVVSLIAPDIQLECSWKISELPWNTMAKASRTSFYRHRQPELNTRLVDALEPYVLAALSTSSDPPRNDHHTTVLAFLYLYMSLQSPESYSCTYTLRSAIPIGAGLGSSAAMTTCFACALLLQNTMSRKGHVNRHLPVAIIRNWAFVGEQLTHGNPSGVDTVLSSSGRAVLFQRRGPNQRPAIKQISRFPDLPLLVVNTKQSRSTKSEVAKVARLKQSHHQAVDAILSAIGSVTESAANLVSSVNFDPQAYADLQRLGELFAANHGLLSSLGLSHPRIERVRAIIDQAGHGWTKLTGAGGGGCTISLLKSSAIDTPMIDQDFGTSTNTITDMRQQLHQEGLEAFPVRVAGEGVGVLYPASLSNVLGSINQQNYIREQFLLVQGENNLQDLVGFHSRGDKEVLIDKAWMFWSSERRRYRAAL